MYHYVRAFARTQFPAIHGMELDAFAAQIARLQSVYEMASLESALAFLSGSYRPPRDLCLLTFDDGLKEHYANVSPLLQERGIRGVFFLITSGAEGQRVASAHMSHFLTASLGFAEYRRQFCAIAKEMRAGLEFDDESLEPAARRAYRWDSPEVAVFKYVLAFVMDREIRDRAIGQLFERRLGDEDAFARELYLNWGNARDMQEAGHAIGGHSHRHQFLAGLPDNELLADLNACSALLRAHLVPQPHWPFCYPYGRLDSFDQRSVQHLSELGFDCSFSTERGANHVGANPFYLTRNDCKDFQAS